MADQGQSLKSLFEDILVNYDKIDKGDMRPADLQPLIKSTITQLEQATNLINIGEVFSSNEMLEEIPTDCIQYLAIPCMLGVLAGKLQTGDRLNNLEVSEIYLKDFLKRGKDYGLVPESMQADVAKILSGNVDLTKMVMDRKEKIKKYEEQKKITSDLVSLKQNLEWAEEEVRREYFTLFVKSFVNIAEEELRSIAMEKPLAAMRRDDPNVGKPKKMVAPVTPLKPVIITRNELQKKVYGMGYPSLPTMTVDEFYEERVREGIFPKAGASQYAKSLQDNANPEIAARAAEEEDEQKELTEEADDPDDLAKARAMDEFKDDHRRGWGNRHNRS